METSSGSTMPDPPISPRSPPRGALDLYGKRRQMLKVQVLEREIGLLQEELKSLEELQPASKICKELYDYVGAKPDPFVAVNQETRKSKSFWKRLWCRTNFCGSFPCICCSSSCFSSCSCRCLQCPTCSCSCCCAPVTCRPRCPTCPSCSCNCKCSCLRNLSCSNCCPNCCTSCCRNCFSNCCSNCCCCKCPNLSCLCQPCCCFISSIKKCKKVNLCSNLAKCCHYVCSCSCCCL